LIELLLTQGVDPAAAQHLPGELETHIASVEASAGRGDRNQVGRIEAEVRKDPEGAFQFDSRGMGAIQSAEGVIPAGRFETAPLRALRERAAAASGAGRGGRVRFWVLDGASPATDIGSLQATAGPGTLFQVASQFNCLESPGAYLVPVADYVGDSTQGPRAAVSAFSGTLLRHYAAPRPDGTRFVQVKDGQQVNLLESVCAPGLASVRNGYLTAGEIPDPSAFARALEQQFEDIRVGVHDDVPVLLGYDWDGVVEGERRIGQVLTSTLAGGAYSGISRADARYLPICRTLLRAAYLGTLLAGVALGRRKVVLTLIGGGAFENPIPLIWESILWAIGEVEPMVQSVMDVVLNERKLLQHVCVEQVLSSVRERDGALVKIGRARVSVER
jgi:hypothetical protein